MPPVDFLKLAATSRMIDKGTNVGLPFVGAAPDLGAYEFGAIITTGTGGMSGAGGSRGTGGAPTAGMGGATGTTGAGGAPAGTGGSTSGPTGTGGATGTGGPAGSGGSNGGGGAGPGPGENVSGGCGCAIDDAGASRGAALAMLGMFSLLVLGRRRPAAGRRRS
jgi:MYXO-CTERM domain-containing protein